MSTRLELVKGHSSKPSGADVGVVLPAYTHLREPNPIGRALWLAYCEKLERERDRLATAAHA